MSTRFVVHGWGVKGPTFDVETRRNGFRFRVGLLRFINSYF